MKSLMQIIPASLTAARAAQAEALAQCKKLGMVRHQLLAERAACEERLKTAVEQRGKANLAARVASGSGAAVDHHRDERDLQSKIAALDAELAAYPELDAAARAAIAAADVSYVSEFQAFRAMLRTETKAAIGAALRPYLDAVRLANIFDPSRMRFDELVIPAAGGSGYLVRGRSVTIAGEVGAIDTIHEGPQELKAFKAAFAELEEVERRAEMRRDLEARMEQGRPQRAMPASEANGVSADMGSAVIRVGKPASDRLSEQVPSPPASTPAQQGEFGSQVMVRAVGHPAGSMVLGSRGVPHLQA